MGKLGMRGRAADMLGAMCVIGAPLAALWMLAPVEPRWELTLERRGEVAVLDHGMTQDDCWRAVFSNLPNDPEAQVRCQLER